MVANTPTQEIGAPLGVPESPKVIYASKGRVAYITINRPQVLNVSCSAALALLLREAGLPDACAVAGVRLRHLRPDPRGLPEVRRRS